MCVCGCGCGGFPARIMGWMNECLWGILQFDQDGLAIDSQGVKYQKISDQTVIPVPVEPSS